MLGIIFDYYAAQYQIKRLEETAAKLRGIAETDFNEALQTIASGWNGDSMRQYMTKCQMLREKMLRTARNLERAAAEFRRQTRAFRDAEEMAKKAATDRIYGGGGSGGGGGGFR